MKISFINDDKFLKKEEFEKFINETNENLVITDKTYKCFIDYSTDSSIFRISNNYNKNNFLLSKVISKRFTYSSIKGIRYYDQLKFFLFNAETLEILGTIHLSSIKIKYNFKPNTWFETKDIKTTGILSDMVSCKYMIEDKGKISIDVQINE